MSHVEKKTLYTKNKLFKLLSQEVQNFLLQLADDFRFTFQEFRKVVEFERDLQMWGEPAIQEWWKTQAVEDWTKKKFLQKLDDFIAHLKNSPAHYIAGGEQPTCTKQDSVINIQTSARKIEGLCPVASEETVCCNLRTIDAVENCLFGCSYCTIQTFYKQQINFDSQLQKKLKQIKIDPKKYIHFGTGQSSDSLAWGNRNGILTDLCNFAQKNPNILLELKTKSANISYFREQIIPANIVLTWSLNPQLIIEHEEHFTASLQKRLEAAREVSRLGIKVGFHFHPLIYFSGWEDEYSRIAAFILKNFKPQEVLFISFGTVTLIKPVIRKIRQLGNQTKILQAPLSKDPKGKYTYPDRLKIKLFSHMLQQFSSWREQVFFYLCMEKPAIWQQTFGFSYPSNEDFERAFGRQVMKKQEFSRGEI